MELKAGSLVENIRDKAIGEVLDAQSGKLEMGAEVHERHIERAEKKARDRNEKITTSGHVRLAKVSPQATEATSQAAE